MTRRAWSAALATALLTTFASLVGVQPASADTTTARSLLYKVAVAAEGGSSTYDRSYFKHWIDTNGDCQGTRAEVLIAESKVTPTYTTSNHCAVAKGKWYSYYDGTTWTNPSDVDIDHLVALKEAWECPLLVKQQPHPLRQRPRVLAVPGGGHRQREPVQERPRPGGVAAPADGCPVHLRDPVGAGEIPVAAHHQHGGAAPR